MPTRTARAQTSLTTPLAFPALLGLLLPLFCFLPRAQSSRPLQLSFIAAAAVIACFSLVLRSRVLSTHRKLEVEFAARPVHYVQILMHSSVYAYWGWYWREVYSYVPLILAQIVFAYALDILICYSRRNKWIAGFGPFPIILSTNLFLWFRDDWFFLQFVMISVGVIGKEFIQWKREGRTTHIFNPSAVGLFLFSVILIATRSTGITWGIQIAESLHRPPNIYLEIFVLGLVVQGLFAVTLVTLCAAAMLVALNLIYTRITGVYQFIDSNIPVSVFLGLHLLITDPATSPRSRSGKAIFGSLYGLSVFGLYSLLTTLHAPPFYDKLLCVPPLNLTVRWLDRVGDKLDLRAVMLLRRFHAPPLLWAGTPRQQNFVFMSLWVALFAVLLFSGFVTTGVIDKPHPGSDPEFWARACDANLHKACPAYTLVLNAECERGSASACIGMARMTSAGLVVPRQPEAAARGYGRACDLGDAEGCREFIAFVEQGGSEALSHACSQHDANSCFFFATVLKAGRGIPQDQPRALALFEQSCRDGYIRGCGVAGSMYLNAEGTASNPALALLNFERSCAGQWGQSCAEAAQLYHRADIPRHDEALSQQRFAQACDLGFEPACQHVYGGALASTILR